MALSAFDLYSLVGPSSSHTVGPMRAGRRFVRLLDAEGLLPSVGRVRAELFGPGRAGAGRGTLLLAGKHRLGFDRHELGAAGPAQVPARAPQRNGVPRLRRRQPGAEAADLLLRGGEASSSTREPTGADRVVADTTRVRCPFDSGAELLAHCARENLSISDFMLANEQAWRPEAEVRTGLLHLWSVMRASVDRGCRREGVLPGGLRHEPRTGPVPRPELEDRRPGSATSHGLGRPCSPWPSTRRTLSGGRIVTATTNGAASITPAILHYYARFVPGADDDGVVRFLLYRRRDRHPVQAERLHLRRRGRLLEGEVGSACSMAAGALCEVLGQPGQGHLNDDATPARDMKVKYKETARGGLAVNVIDCDTMTDFPKFSPRPPPTAPDRPRHGAGRARTHPRLPRRSRHRPCRLAVPGRARQRHHRQPAVRRPPRRPLLYSGALRHLRQREHHSDPAPRLAAAAAPFAMQWHLESVSTPRRVLVLVSRYGHCLNDLPSAPAAATCPSTWSRWSPTTATTRHSSPGTTSRSSTRRSPPRPNPRRKPDSWKIADSFAVDLVVLGPSGPVALRRPGIRPGQAHWSPPW